MDQLVERWHSHADLPIRQLKQTVTDLGLGQMSTFQVGTILVHVGIYYLCVGLHKIPLQ